MLGYSALDDEAEESAAKTALEVLHTLAVSVSATVLFPLVMHRSVAFLRSNSAGTRLAGMASMARIVEGCADAFRDALPQVIEMVAAGLGDASAAVRKAACLALTNLGEALEEDVSEYHALLLPLLVKLIDSGSASGETVVMDSSWMVDTTLDYTDYYSLH